MYNYYYCLFIYLLFCCIYIDVIRWYALSSNKVEVEVEPYHQNVPESVNHKTKEWTNFVPQDLDKFVLSVYSFVESLDTETELGWFGISDKWEVREGFVQHMLRAYQVSMTAEARKAALNKVNIVTRNALHSSTQANHIQAPLQLMTNP